MIIGLCSQAPQAGKDTVAKFLFEHGFVRVAFGDSIKEYCISHYHWNGKKDEKGRQLLTNIAMKMRDEVDPYFWIKQTIPALNTYIKQRRPIVVTDVRMLIEHDYLRQNYNDFVLVQVMRDSVTKGKDARTQVEIQDMTIDYKLDNNGSIEDLHSNVVKMLKDLKDRGLIIAL
jgi:dephospho-CoA kinase